MSRKPTRKKKAANLSRKKMSELWAALDPAKFKEYLAKNDVYKNDGKWSLKGSMINGRCRAQEHAGKDIHPSMVIYPKKGFAKCYTCGHYETDLGTLLSPIFNKDSQTVLKELQSHFNVKIYKSSDIRDTEVYAKHVSMKNQLAKIFNQELESAITEYRAGTLKDGELYYAEPMVQYLEKRDPLLLDYAGNLPIGIFVDQTRLVKTARNMGIAGSTIEAMKDYLKNYVIEYYLGALVMFYHENMKDVARFRLRMPDSVNDEGKKEKVIRAIDDELAEDLGIFGLASSAGVMDVHEKNPKALLSEGEFDAMAVMVNQMALNDPTWIPISHSGNAAAGKLSALENTPIENVYYVPDHDNGGINNAKMVLSNNYTLSIRVFNWPIGITVPAAPTTDLSESINAYGFEKVNAELRELDTNYAKREAWAKNRVNEECHGLDTDDSDDFANIKQITQDYAACVGDINDPNTHDQVKKWITDVLTFMGVSSSEITSITVSASSEDDPERAFVSLLGINIEDRYAFVAYEPEERKILVWDKDKRHIFRIRTGSDSLMKTDIGNMLGDIRVWVLASVAGGIPGFISHSDQEGKNPRTYLQIDSLLADHIRMAIRQKIPNLKPIEKFERYADGCHWLKTSAGDRIFVVNGNHVYMGYFTDNTLYWEELVVPTFEDYYFDLSKNPWTDNIKDVTDLRNAPAVELATILETNTDIINTGWTFTDQKSEPAILGSWATISTVVKIFGANLQFLASNERSCGKSALYAELFGGGKGTDINLTEHTQYVDNITPAGMRQAMDGSGRILIIDEFDNQKGSRGTQEKQEEVLTMLRTASGGDGIFLQGTTSGKPRKYRFSVSTMLAGIDPEMTEANQTRLITTDLKSGLDGRLPPQASILEKFSKERLREIRKINTLSVFTHIPAILSAYNEVQKEILDNPDVFGEGVMQRFKESLAKIVCVFKAAYPNTDKWKQVGKIICNAKKLKLSSLKNATANAALIENLLYSFGVEVTTPLEKKQYSLIQLISTSEIVGDSSSVNNSNVGVWFQPSIVTEGSGNIQKYFLFIQWRIIKSTLFKYNNRWKQPPSQLKAIASRHPRVLNESKARAIYEKEKAIPTWIGGEKDDPFSVLDITDYVVTGQEREVAHQEHTTSTAYQNTLPGGSDENVSSFGSL